MGNSLTAIQNAIQSSVAAGVSSLVPAALSLAATIFVISIALRFLQEMAEDRFNLVPFCLSAALKGGGWAFLINEYPAIANEWLEGCLWVGSTMGGGSMSTSDLTNPSAIVNAGFTAAEPLYQFLLKVGAMDTLSMLATILMLVPTYLLIILSFFIIAWQILITFVEFYLIMGPALMLLGFGPWQKSAFLAEMGLKGIVGIGVKVMVLSSLIGIVFPLIKSFSAVEPDIKNSLVFLGCTFGIALLTWFAPTMAAGLMSGSPQLSVGTATGAAASAMSSYSMVTNNMPGMSGGGGSGGGSGVPGTGGGANSLASSKGMDTGGGSNSNASTSSSNLSGAAGRIQGNNVDKQV